jgi:hypothetical protein
MILGPDGLLYVSAFCAHQAWRYNPMTRTFIEVFVSGIEFLHALRALATLPNRSPKR